MGKKKRVPCAVQFNGKLLFPASCLTAEDLMGRDADVVIERVAGQMFEGDGGEKESRLVLSFRGKTKKLVITAKAQANMIHKVTGTPKAIEWVGKAITIYPTTCSAFGDSETPCIRIRPKAPVIGGVSASPPASTEADEPPFGGPMSDEERDRSLAEQVGN